AEDVTEAADLLRRGGLVAFPTETVYGLGGLATDGQAVAGIFAAKGRPNFNPLIVHVVDRAAAERLAVPDDTARALADRFWPGPLTLVLPLREGHGLSPLVTAGLDTVAIRVPAAPLAQTLLAAVGGPVAAPSANPSGRVSATRAEHVLAGLGGQVDAVLDGGPCPVGLESTIMATAPPVLLREGGLAAEEIEAVVGAPLTRDVTPGRVQAPGQLASHYAPGRPVRLQVTEADPEAVLIGFGPVAGDLTLSRRGDLAEAAANLFDHLHGADALAGARGAAFIDVAPVPETGLGRAINDRLRRAAAPR
ncbi:MAG: L-threonylcarbamoyladenylate synthase, partial [Pseudomonadota bacterium]